MRPSGKATRRALAGAVAIAVAVSAGIALAAPNGGPANSDAKAISGTGKANHLVGTRGPDVIDGKKGDDVINGRAGRDSLSGGKGNDRILARDGTEDTIDCGPGAHDVAVVDRSEDGVYDCEKVRTPGSGQKRGGR